MSIHFWTGTDKMVSKQTQARATFELAHMKEGLWKYMTQL